MPGFLANVWGSWRGAARKSTKARRKPRRKAAQARLGLERLEDRVVPSTIKLIPSIGANGDGFSGPSALSPDGRYIAFHSSASNLVTSDTNDVADVFVRDTWLGTTTRVSTDSAGAQVTGGGSFVPAIAVASSGTVYVAFESDATNLVSGDTNGMRDIFVKNLSTNQTTRVSTSSSGVQSNAASFKAAIAIAGSTVFVTYYSNADNLVSVDSNATFDVFVKNVATNATTRASTKADGAEAAGGDSYNSALAVAPNGNVLVAFLSSANYLLSGDNNLTYDVYVKNLTSGQISRASTGSGGIKGNLDASTPPSLAFDASGNVLVAFDSKANNLVTGDSNCQRDIFLKNLGTGQTARINTDSVGAQANLDSINPILKSDAGGTGNTTLSYIVTGTLPAGLSISPASPATNSFTISGTPTTGGSATISVTATHTVNATATASYALNASWGSYAQNPEHTGVSSVPSQRLDAILWQTPVDLQPQYSGDDLFIHYGSPLITAANTVIVPVKTGASGGFKLQGIDAITGSVKWNQTTDYILPPHNWVPSFSPTLAPNNRLYFAGAGGTVYYIDNPDSPGASTNGQLAFYGLSSYTSNPAAYNNNVFINTPITADSSGNIYFGFMVTGSTPLGLQSGIARIATDGSGTWIAAATAANGGGVTKVVHNNAPALSNDGQVLYVAVSNGNGSNFGEGYLVALNSTNLQPIVRVQLKDANSGNNAFLAEDGSASPMVGPDGDVYFGVLENPFPSNHDRGWLLHFSSDLSQIKTPGAFGWDDTASVVPASMVPSYHGSSDYLLMTKYNNYAGAGGDGFNRLAILDPFASMTDPITGASVMQEVMTILGPTPDPEFVSTHPGAVREWCINTAAVDPFTNSIMANSEDGKLYRWDLTTNTFTQQVTLTNGVGEAYTPTVIGVDGAVYAINNATLFAIGEVHFQVIAPTSATAGSAYSITVAAKNKPGNIVTGYVGTVHVTTSDTAAGVSVPGNYTFVLSENGVHTFTNAVTLVTAGSQIVSVADIASGAITGTSNSVTILPAAATHFTVSTSTNATAGSAFSFSVVARDQFNNPLTTYTGTVHFSSSDAQAILPSDVALTSGAGTFSATLATAGSQTLTATDTTTSSISGVSAAISTHGLEVSGFAVTATGLTATFNKAFDATVLNLYDAFGDFGVSDVTLARNAIQTITFSPSLANNSTFTLAFNRATTTPITYTNTSAATLATNIQNALDALSTIGAGNTLVSAISTASVTVTFQNARGFRAVSQMTSPSPAGTPKPVQIVNTTQGSSNLRGTLLLNADNQGFTFLLSGTGSGGVLPADVYQATIRSALTGFKDLFGASLDGNNDLVLGDDYIATFTVATTPTVILSVPDFARGPDSIYTVRIPNGPAGEEIQTMTFTGTADGSTFTLAFNGQTASGITYSTSVATLQSNIQTALESLSNISSPNDFNFRRADLLVTAADASNVTVRFQNVLGGFDQPQITATSPGSTVSTGTSTPGINTGIPISLVGGNLGSGVTAMTFDLVYDPALLNITGAYSIAGGSSFTLVSTPSGGVAHFSYSRNSAPALGATATLGHIVATVPHSAETNFKTKQLLQLTNIVATGAAATVVGNSGVQVVDFFGDANGDGKVTGGDAALVARVNSAMDTIPGTTQVGGLGAYRMLDPFVMTAFVASGNGMVLSSDVTLINSYMVESRTQIPTRPPITDMSLSVVGPDPTLSLPSDLRAAAGETVVVPVNIDITRPGASPGMMEAILALRYDTKVFTVSASDIHLGSVPSTGNGWQLRTAISAQTGEIGINIYSMNPILTRGGGSLVTVSLHVREGAVAGASAINLVTAVNPTGNSEYVTSVNDSINQYILNPVVTDGFDAGVDGRVTVPAPLVSTSMTAGPQFVFTPGTATAEAAGFEPFEPVQLSAVVTSDLPQVVLEEVFSDFEAAALYLAASGLGKSTTQDMDKNHIGAAAHDLAMLWSNEGVAPQTWMSDDSLTVLGKSPRHGKRLLATDLGETNEEKDDVEEFFVRQP